MAPELQPVWHQSHWGLEGKVVEAVTTEYINGEKQKRVEKFRAYNSYADSFMDFANLIRNNPRYDNVIGNGQDISSYAQALQRAVMPQTPSMRRNSNALFS